MSSNELVKRYSRPPMGGQAAKPGEVEAWGLMQAALRMKESRERNEPAAMLHAVRLNWRLWTIFQAELLDPNCTIPAEIRMNLLSLANFIDQHSVAFIGEPKPEQMEVLISINRELAGGLYEVRWRRIRSIRKRPAPNLRPRRPKRHTSPNSPRPETKATTMRSSA